MTFIREKKLKILHEKRKKWALELFACFPIRYKSKFTMLAIEEG
jgi:acyl-CoA hydrolase